MHGKSEAYQPDLPVEIVLYLNDTAKHAHQQLFTLADASYTPINGKLTDSIIAAAFGSAVKVHIAADWETILKVALWTSEKPTSHDVHALLKKMGVAEGELLPFAKSDINDLFPWLYYGKKFDTLRKICNAAKARAESRIEKKTVLVYCHLVFSEPQKIIASSL